MEVAKPKTHLIGAQVVRIVQEKEVENVEGGKSAENANARL